MMYDILQLNDMLVPELKEIAAKLSLPNYKKLSKQDLIYKILDEQALKNKHTVKDDELESNRNLPKTMPMEAGLKPDKKQPKKPEKPSGAQLKNSDVATEEEKQPPAKNEEGNPADDDGQSENKKRERTRVKSSSEKVVYEKSRKEPNPEDKEYNDNSEADSDNGDVKEKVRE